MPIDEGGNGAGRSKSVRLVSGKPPDVITAMEFIFEMLGELFVALDGLTLIADVYAWVKGRRNRLERREARRDGEPVPPRDNWNNLVVVLSLLALILTGVIVAGIF